MGKLTDAFKKLEAGKNKFVADVEKWQVATKNHHAGFDAYQKKLGELSKIDDVIINQIGNDAARSAKAAELAGIRGKKLEHLWPDSRPAWDAQKQAFDNCDAFEKVIGESETVLKAYDTKGKATKEQKKIDAKKLLLQAKVDLAEIKKCKINYEYQGDGAAQYSDV
jgi:hypothetical protein